MELEKIKGVGEATIAKLADLGITTVGGLLSFLPSKYVNLKLPEPALYAEEGQFCLFSGEVVKATVPSQRGTKSFTVTFLDKISDKKVYFKAVFYNRPYLQPEFEIGRSFRLLSKISFASGEILLVNPTVEPEDKIKRLGQGVFTVYPLKGIIGQGTFKNLVESALEYLRKSANINSVFDVTEEYSSPESTLKTTYLTLSSAHMPNSAEECKDALNTLASLDFACGLYNYKNSRKNASKERKVFYNFKNFGTLWFENLLDWDLTGTQKDTMNEISNDLNSSKSMSRIVYGDVGSGKSVVAYFALAKAFDGGMQSAYMCPTEILAGQQYQKFLPLANALGMKVALLTSSTKRADRAEILDGLSSGEINAVFGTQSLIGAEVEYKCLSLAVIDEQHKFGVSSRTGIEEKGASDILTLTATPIPRTLALTVYDDIDVSKIEKRESAKTHISTKLISDTKLGDLIAYIARECRAGKQAFIICPTIKDCEGNDLYSIEQFAKDYIGYFDNLTVSILHGKMSDNEKNEVMQGFSNGEISVLVATSLVEVGIDTKANIIAVLNADRFGLASLHQLRGRVGRDGTEAFCFLHTKATSTRALDRLVAMKNFDDGSLLAEKDLEMRGSGDILGAKQSGSTATPYFKLPLTINVLRDAKRILRNDSNGKAVSTCFKELFNADYEEFVRALETVTLNS